VEEDGLLGRRVAWCAPAGELAAPERRRSQSSMIEGDEDEENGVEGSDGKGSG
jgi:hypothetical protein